MGGAMRAMIENTIITYKSDSLGQANPQSMSNSCHTCLIPMSYTYPFSFFCLLLLHGMLSHTMVPGIWCMIPVPCYLDYLNYSIEGKVSEKKCRAIRREKATRIIRCCKREWGVLVHSFPRACWKDAPFYRQKTLVWLIAWVAIPRGYSTGWRWQTGGTREQCCC